MLPLPVGGAFHTPLMEPARPAFESSMRYRSACLFGTCSALAGQEAAHALGVFTERVLPGRSAEVRASTGRELAATLVVALFE